MTELASGRSDAPKAMDMFGLGPTLVAIAFLFGLLFRGGFTAESVGTTAGGAVSGFILALPLYAMLRFGTARGRAWAGVRRLNIMCLLTCAMWLALGGLKVAQWSATRHTAPAARTGALAPVSEHREMQSVSQSAEVGERASSAPSPSEAHALQELARLHPDWQQVDADPAFKAFVSALPPDRRAALAEASARYDPVVVASEIAAFKQQRNKQARQGAATPTR